MQQSNIWTSLRDSEIVCADWMFIVPQPLRAFLLLHQFSFSFFSILPTFAITKLVFSFCLSF